MSKERWSSSCLNDSKDIGLGWLKLCVGAHAAHYEYTEQQIIGAMGNMRRRTSPASAIVFHSLFERNTIGWH